MGVKGLLSWCLRNSPALEQCPQGAALIDSHAFFFWFLATFVPGQPDSMAQVLSTDYEEVSLLMLGFLAVLEFNGVHPEFIVDGKPATNTKDAFLRRKSTWLSRRKDQKRRLDHMEKVLTNCTSNNAPLTELGKGGKHPFAKVTFVLRRILKLNGYFLHSCEGEADVVLDHLSDPNAGSQPSESDVPIKGLPPISMVITNDTDLILMPNTNVIMLQTWSTSPFGQAVREQTIELYNNPDLKPRLIRDRGVVLWTRERVKRITGLSDSDLAVLSIVCGNDGSSHLTPTYCGKIDDAIHEIKRAPVGNLEIAVDGQKQMVRTRNPLVVMGWDPKGSKADELHKVFLAVLSVMGIFRSKAQKERIQWDVAVYQLVRGASYGTRLGCQVGNRDQIPRDLKLRMRHFSIQTLRDFRARDVIDFLTRAQLIDMPSYHLGMAGKVRTHLCDMLTDQAASLDRNKRVALHDLCARFRRRIVGYLLHDESGQLDDQPIVEWRHTTQKATEEVRLLPIFPPRSLPLLVDLPSLPDYKRVDLYLAWFICEKAPKVRVKFPGPIGCSLAWALYNLSPRLGDENLGYALLLMVIIMVSSRATRTLTQFRENCLDYLSGLSDYDPSVEERLPKKLCTLSAGANWLMLQDLHAFVLPPQQYQTFAETLHVPQDKTIATYICQELDRIAPITPTYGRMQRYIPSCRQLAIWNRFTDCADHMMWGMTLFLLSQNAPFFFQDFMNFELFQLLGQGPDAGRAHAKLRPMIRQLHHAAKVLSWDSWFKDLYAALSNQGRQMKGQENRKRALSSLSSVPSFHSADGFH